MKTINIKTIRIDGGTQSRVEINNEIVTDYAEAIKAGADIFWSASSASDLARHSGLSPFERSSGSSAKSESRGTPVDTVRPWVNWARANN